VSRVESRLPSGRPVRVLVVDDDVDVRDVLRQEFERRGFAVDGAASAAEARGLFGDGGRYELALCDIDMPGERGTELLAWLKATDPDVAVMMVTGLSDAATAVAAMLNGASDYVCKPFSLAEVRARTDQALERRRLVLENRAYQTNLERLVEERTHEVLSAMAEIRALSDDLRAAYDATLVAMLSALDKRDNETQGHSLRVVAYTERLAKEIGIGEPGLTAIRRGALLHDVGKIGVPDAILRKPGKLDHDEWLVMKKHSELGYEMLRDIRFLRDAALIVLTHQERFDGGGYPRGLRGEEIPIGARIFACADALDAMTSDRPYRKALPYERVRQELIDYAGTQFDPLVVEAFLRIPPDHWRRIRDASERLVLAGTDFGGGIL
jgi:putative nucleotidyltransferase with HDIG domain